MHYARWRRLDDKGSEPLDRIEAISDDPTPAKSPGRPTVAIGTKRVSDSGHVYVKVSQEHLLARPDRIHGTWVLEHRKVMAEHLGRAIKKWEKIRHKDGNKQNNSIDNLELV